MNLEPHIDILTRFGASHLIGTDHDNGLIQLKIDHSLRVLDNARLIVDGENISGQTATLCQLAALYHDIGRFPQFAKYRTFNDRESTNHGRLGVLTLRDLDLPGDLSARDWCTVRFAVAQHNLKSTRDTLPSHLATPTQLVRDADKIDIFRVMVDHFSSDNPDPVVTHGFDDIPGVYTDEIYDAVMAEQTGDYRLIRCSNDFKLLIIGWLYNLHFMTSIALIAENNYLEQLFSLLPKDDKIQRLEEKINKFMRYKSD